jgi:hypothetical protein
MAPLPLCRIECRGEAIVYAASRSPRESVWWSIACAMIHRCQGERPAFQSSSSFPTALTRLNCRSPAPYHGEVGAYASSLQLLPRRAATPVSRRVVRQAGSSARPLAGRLHAVGSPTCTEDAPLAPRASPPASGRVLFLFPWIAEARARNRYRIDLNFPLQFLQYVPPFA